MNFDFFIKSFRIGATTIKPPRKGVTVFVGPNNSGKTRTLLGITQKAKNANLPTTIVDRITVEKVGSVSDLREWLKANYRSVMGNTTNNSDPQYVGYGDQGVHEENLETFWEKQEVIGALGNLLIEEVTVENRLNFYDAQEARRFNPKRDVRPGKMSHVLMMDESIEQNVFDATRSLLGGAGLTVGRSVEGDVIELFGTTLLQRKAAPEVEWFETPKYQRLLDQGSGTRAAVSLVNLFKLTKARVLGIDEPELFLHPPLAFKIGRLIAELGNERQVLVATHSASLLNGIISGNCPVKVLRLTKNEAKRKIAVKSVDEAVVARIWKDPRLRYAGLAEGIFHDAVVLCENHTDCMFYSAAVDFFYSSSSAQQPEILFIDCSGKHSLHKFMAPMREMGVPVMCVTDIDYILPQRDERGDNAYLKPMCQLLGIEWATTKTAITSIDGKYDRNSVKKHGLTNETSVVVETINSIATGFRDKGICVLRTGELESFAPDISPTVKTEWFNSAMENRVFEREGPQQLAKELDLYLRGSR